MTAESARIRTQAFLLGFLAVCLFIYICKIGQAVMIPFVVAVFLWYLINALVRFFGLFQTEGGRRLPVSLRYALSITVLCGLAFLVFELVHQNIDDVTKAAPRFQESFEKIVAQAAHIAGLQHVPSMKEIVDELMAKYIDIGTVIRGFAGLLTDMAAKAVVVVFFLIFLMYEQRFFNLKIRWMFRDSGDEERVRGILRVIDRKVQKYIGVKAFVSALDSTLTFGILTFFGVDFAAFWGVMAFFLHFIPYAGSFVAITLPVLIALIQFGDLGHTLMVLTALCISHAFLGHILDPYMMGNNLNLSPIFIITNLAMWGMLWGIPGMFLAIPILAITALALEQFPATRKLAILISKTGVLSSPSVPAPRADR